MPALLWSAAFLAGLAGSAHCLGMCGGIATALGACAPVTLPRPWWDVLYHTGRILSYASFGALAGAIGAVGGHYGGSALLRLATAVVIILMGLNLTARGTPGAAWLRTPERLGAKLWRRVKPLMARHLPQRAVPRALLTGALWGWLPCGLVYSALLASTAGGSAVGGAATMVAFGVGTVPALAGLSGLTRRLPHLAGGRQRPLGLVVIACGLWTAVIPAGVLSSGQPQCEHGVVAPARTR